MSSRLILAAVAALTFAAPVLAQTPAPAPVAPAPAAPATTAAAPTEADIEAAGNAFEADLQKLGEELDAAKAAAGSDTAKANADADTITARYQASADAFAEQLNAFLATQSALLPPEAMAQMPMVIAQIRGAPAHVRQSHMAAPAATEAPAAQ